MENIGMITLPVKRGGILEGLGRGHMIIARSKNAFLYILERDNRYQLILHEHGAAGARRNQVPKYGQNTAAIQRLADRSEYLYEAEFDRALDIYTLMRCAEEGILSIFPDGDGGPV
ncbi:hypothetical protein SAMN02745823_03231 [Sporobacter termitidis DSM 10068]|uniref:Uncharacterized protein n=1 Tax=Sporobacter termitidis DSM 10068 TaxID=1123282 RepID=A0A1M5Z4U7_9FIRM|nr:hypothetical protein [Sporobacter termitidis]SHI19230.1 hypothetical protein SAMN02745823_03231 [Sporobacter termitidis DSM 10068]